MKTLKRWGSGISIRGQQMDVLGGGIHRERGCESSALFPYPLPSASLHLTVLSCIIYNKLVI